MSSVREPGKYSINLSDRDLEELDKLATATKGQDAQTKKWGYTAILNDVLQRTDTAIDIQKESQAYMQTRVKYMSGFVVVMALLLIANFALTLSAVEMSKESHVKKNSLTDKGGNVVQVSSSDFNLGSGGELVQRSSTSTRAPVGTAPVLSKYKLSSRIPNKYMEELDAFTVSMPCAKDSSAAECDDEMSTKKATVRSFKRVPREGSHCGSVVVFQTDVGEFTLDDATLFQGSTEMASAEGMFSLGSRRLANMNISAHGRQLMEQGAAPAVGASLHGSFKFLANVKAEEFVCKMGGVIGDEFTVLPPKAPPVPYTYIVLKESTCSFGETLDNACESELTQGMKPGVAQHSNFTTIRSYEQVLLTQTHRVVVSYFASQPLSRLVQVLHLQSQVVTQYINYRRSRSKLSCVAKPVEGAKKTKEMNADVHLAYLSTAVDEGLTSMRWALSPYSAQGTIFPLYTEYWERLGSRMPRRLFLKGDLEIAPKVFADLFATPMEFLSFQADMTDAEVTNWYVTTIFQSSAKSAVLCPAQEPAGAMPAYLGPFGEAGARWVASKLVDGDLENFGALIIWPGSYYKYWNAVVAGLDTPSLGGSTVDRQNNVVPPKSSDVDGYRRLSGTMGFYYNPAAWAKTRAYIAAQAARGGRYMYSQAQKGGTYLNAKGKSWNSGSSRYNSGGGSPSDGTRRRGQAARDFESHANHRRRGWGNLEYEQETSYEGDTEDEKIAMRKSPAPTPANIKNKLKSSADMEEFSGCLKSVKDCFSKKRLRRLADDIDANSCEGMARQALSLGGQPCLGWDCEKKDDFGKALLYKTSGKAFTDNLQDASLELACGPCSISLTVNSFKKKIPLPTFACIFEGGTGCYWKASGGGFKMVSFQSLWEKFARSATHNQNQYALKTHNGAYLSASGSSMSSAANLKAAQKIGAKAIWDFDEHGSSRRYYFVNNDNNKAVMDKRGYVQLGGGRGKVERWMIPDKKGGKVAFRNEWRKWWLSAPGGEYGCKICINLIDDSSGKKLGVKVSVCVGMASECWFFVEIIGERVPPPRWANMLGVQVSVAGYLKLCIWPFAVTGWIEIKITKGFCKSIIGFTITFAIYGGLKFEFEYKLGQGAIMTGSAYVGISGGVYRSGWDFPKWGGRRRRRRRRRRHKCRCGRAKGDGTFKSCPRKAGADGRMTFTLKMWPCQKGQDANLMATIGFKMSLDLFGIKISLPKIKDITLFKTKVKKPFGR